MTNTYSFPVQLYFNGESSQRYLILQKHCHFAKLWFQIGSPLLQVQQSLSMPWEVTPLPWRWLFLLPRTCKTCNCSNSRLSYFEYLCGIWSMSFDCRWWTAWGIKRNFLKQAELLVTQQTTWLPTIWSSWLAPKKHCPVCWDWSSLGTVLETWRVALVAESFWERLGLAGCGVCCSLSPIQ